MTDDTERSGTEESNRSQGTTSPENLAFFGMNLPPAFVLWFAVVMVVISFFVIILRTAELLQIGISFHNVYHGILAVMRDIAATIPVVTLSVAMAVHARRARMTIAAYFEQKAREERERNIARGRVEERAEWLAWDARRREAEAKGLPFDEPVPSSKE